MNSHTQQPQPETVYLGVEPIPVAPQPQFAFQPAPQPQIPVELLSPPVHYPPIISSTAALVEDSPEWDRPVAPPAIAQAVPERVIDAASFREAQLRNQVAASIPSSSQYPAQQATASQFQASPPMPPAPPRVAPAGYSPFRDDRNSYHTALEYFGVQYFARELDDSLREYINTFSSRFVENPAHRIVEVTHGVLQPRPIALEEVEGGVITWYGRKQTVQPGHIYHLFPELQGCLAVRHLSVEELEDIALLTEEHPTLFEKYQRAQEEMWDQVIFHSLTGWSVSAPFHLSNVQRLSVEVKRTLFIRIGASSEFGVSQDDWFRDRDRRDSKR